MRESTIVLALASAFMTAKEELIRRGYAVEIDWQYDVEPDAMTEETFLREASWAILSCGISENVVRKRFGRISESFRQWRSAAAIISLREQCRRDALRHFNHAGKIDAVLAVATAVHELGFEVVKARLLADPLGFLERFPYIGPVSSRHVAKNLGFAFAKPDRHLRRLAEAVGYGSVDRLCIDLARILQEPIGVIDFVLWRYAALGQDITGLLSQGCRCVSAKIGGGRWGGDG